MQKKESIMKKNLILLFGVILMVILPLCFVSGEFGGADDQAEGVIEEVDASYHPWFESLWDPPSGEIESLLFALQAAIGAGVICYFIGYQIGKSKRDDEEE